MEYISQNALLIWGFFSSHVLAGVAPSRSVQLCSGKRPATSGRCQFPEGNTKYQQISWRDPEGAAMSTNTCRRMNPRTWSPSEGIWVFFWSFWYGRLILWEGFPLETSSFRLTEVNFRGQKEDSEINEFLPKIVEP